ncbi:MAG TPA: hypothetical protein VIG47_14805 [Gemmatimonadaceae bacterium]
MKLRRLLDTFHSRELWKDVLQQAGSIEELESAASRAFGQNLCQFIAGAL